LQKLLRGRAIQNSMFEGKQRRMELIQELRSVHETNNMDDVMEIEEEERKETQARVAAATVDKTQGEVVSELLDFLSKEHFRAQEHAALTEYVQDAVYERRKREVIEGGRRHAEDLLRSREDAVFHAIQRVHEETADNFIMDIVLNVVQRGNRVTFFVDASEGTIFTMIYIYINMMGYIYIYVCVCLYRVVMIRC
jgi:hypothetical protein